jgi:hypothetical protein
LLRTALLVLGALALLTGLAGGLWRLGWDVPHGASIAALHGPLLICGLFGTLVGLERAVAIGRAWVYAAPAFSALGVVALLAGFPAAAGATGFTLSALVLAAASLMIALRHRAIFTATMLVGALALLAGDLLWLVGVAVPDVSALWLAFLVLTIAGERLELSRVLPPKSGSMLLFVLAVLALLAGALIGLPRESGSALFGAGLLSCAVWLLRHDIVPHNIRRDGQIRFSAACMLPGYAWLATAGALLILMPPATTPFGYDIALHAIAIGFVLSMVFGHALIILPAVLRLRVRYHPALYLPLGLLHAAVLARIIGDLAGNQDLRLWSGPFTLLALFVFVTCMIVAARASVAR